MKIEKNVTILFMGVVLILLSGCFWDKANNQEPVIPKVETLKTIVVENRGSMSFGDTTKYKIYYVKLELNLAQKKVELYLNENMKEEAIVPTSFNGVTAEYDRNILIPDDGTAKALTIVLTDEIGNIQTIKRGL